MFICAIIIDSKGDDWHTEYENSWKVVFEDSGASPSRTFLNLLHIKKLHNEYKYELAEVRHSRPGKDIQTMVSVANFRVENCSRETLMSIDYLIAGITGDNTINVNVYLNYVKERMAQICDDAFDQSNLPFKE